jgi:hypothetical protein
VRLHDARHTAATVLLILGVPVRTVMSNALAAILPFAEAGLAHSDIEAVAGLQAAVNCLRAVLSNDGGDDGPAGSLAPV